MKAMISKQAEAFHERCKRFNIEAPSALKSMTLRQYADSFYESLSGEIVFESSRVNASGVPALRVRPAECDGSATLLFFHGGGYRAGSPKSHARFAAHLAKRLNAQALLPDYRLLPEAKFPAQIEECTTVYNWLLETGLNPKHVAFAGESAGASLVISVQLMAIARRLPMPAAGYAMSPWIDAESRGESHRTNRAVDIMVTPQVSASGFEEWGGGTDPHEPLFNPLYADLSRVSPFLAQSGGDELMRDDAVLLTERAVAQGVQAEAETVPHMQHLFQMCAGVMPESDSAMDRGAAFLKRFLRTD